MTVESRTLRLHHDLYSPSAIDEALELYGAHAQIARGQEGDHVVLSIVSPRAGRAERVARELANYALGLTIQKRSGTPGAAVG